MLPALVGIPVLSLAAILQSAIASRLPLLYGTTDLILLVIIGWGLQERVRSSWIWALIAAFIMSFFSALPPLVPFIGYLALTGASRYLQAQIWKTPILAMFAMTILGTLVMHLLTIAALFFAGTTLPVGQSLELITLPSLMLNLLLALPVYTLVKDMASSLYPVKLDV